MEGRWVIKGKQLILEATESSEEQRYERTSKTPESVRIDAHTLGTRVPDAEEIEDIKFEFELRYKDDQDVRQRYSEAQSKARRAGQLSTPEAEQAFRDTPEMRALMGEMAGIDADNTDRLVELVQDIGWISATRFGKQANNAAFLIVQHSGNLRLMRAALPLIEEEAKENPQLGQNFALLWDRTQLRLGEKQRYGSQLVSSPDGGLCVLRLEDPSRVDEFRAEMGMGVLEDYLALFREDGTEVKMCDE